MTKTTNIFLFLAIATILIATPFVTDSVFADKKDDKKPKVKASMSIWVGSVAPGAEDLELDSEKSNVKIHCKSGVLKVDGKLKGTNQAGNPLLVTLLVDGALTAGNTNIGIGYPSSDENVKFKIQGHDTLSPGSHTVQVHVNHYPTGLTIYINGDDGTVTDIPFEC